MSLQEHIDALAEQPDIAEYFATEGIQGECARPGSCPVAVYLMRRTGSNDIAVGGSWARNFKASGVDYWADLPDKITTFINRFDNYVYPELIAGYDPIADEYTS